MKKIIQFGMTLIASIIIILGLLFIILPGPAIIILPLGIWLFNKYQPGKIDPYARKFMAYNQRFARWLDKILKSR